MGRPFPFLLFYGILYGRRTVFGSPARYAPVWRRGAETPGRPPRPRNALSAGGFGAADPGAGAAAESVSGRAAPDGCVICAAAGAEAWPWVCVPYGAGVWAGRTAHPRAFGARRPGSPLLCGTAAAGLALRRARRAPCSAQAQGADGLSGRGIPPFFGALYGRPVPAGLCLRMAQV